MKGRQMVTIGEQRMWHDISAGARALVKIADAIQKIVDAEYSDPEPEKDDLPLTKSAWRSEVASGKTELGFDDWLIGRRDA
jgi:hypothetical protein